MGSIPQVVTCLSILVFIAAVVSRIVMWRRMPIQVRWELYPVPHEGKKAGYGGSYLEESEWWKAPREFSIWGELKVMIPEILFLVALKEHNPRMWLCSFPFHLGLYLIAAGTGLMTITLVLGGFLSVELESIASGLFIGLGVAGLLLGMIGAVGLLLRRAIVPELRHFSSPADYFNLIFFVVAFGVSLISFSLKGQGFFEEIREFAWGLLTFSFLNSGNSLDFTSGLSIILMASLMAYIPLTHMSHFIGKYFAYHSVRWNDEPNLPGGDQEAEILNALSQPISWGAPHIQGDGRKTWVDVAMSSTEEVNKK